MQSIKTTLNRQSYCGLNFFLNYSTALIGCKLTMVQQFFQEESQDGIKATAFLSHKTATKTAERDIKSGLLNAEIQRLKDRCL